MDRSKLVGVLVGLVVAGVVAARFSGSGGLFGGSIESKLKRTADEINRQCPMRVDALTVLTHVDVGPGKSYAYMYTIDTSLTPAQGQELEANIRSKALSSPELKPILDEGVTIWYKYHDRTGRSVLEFSVAR